MDELIKARLLQAISADHLMILAGAGLSMAPPNPVPGAAAVAAICQQRYELEGLSLPADVSGDVEKIARHFFDTGSLDHFLTSLVPWEEFRKTPNEGHVAIADFLACGSIHAAITTNFDALIEEAAARLGEPRFQSIVFESELAVQTPHRPLLKIHGCEARKHIETVWCSDQLKTPPLHARLERFREWLHAHLPGRDLILVGFWTDWHFLSEVFASHLPAFAANGTQWVFLVSPDEPLQLSQKAPKLWAWANSGAVTFKHLRVSGDKFLHELRKLVSQVFLNRVWAESAQLYEALFGVAPPAAPPDLSTSDCDDLYQLRRNLTGVPSTGVVRARIPSDTNKAAGAYHRRVIDCGGVPEAGLLQFMGSRLRIIDGAGSTLSLLKARYAGEAPTPVGPNEVVCIGAVEDNSPANLIRGTPSSTILRSGLVGSWITHDAIRPLLQVTP